MISTYHVPETVTQTWLARLEAAGKHLEDAAEALASGNPEGGVKVAWAVAMWKNALLANRVESTTYERRNDERTQTNGDLS